VAAARRVGVVAAVLILGVVLAALSRLPFGSLLSAAWLGAFGLTATIALPALVLTPGEPVARVPLAGRTVIIVDDGIATGSTARAACRIARAEGAAKVVLAVPVAPPDWIERIGDDADEFVCIETPESFYAVGQFYVDFPQTTDEQVVECLTAARRG
jgi:hypothetical protein